MPEKIKKVDWIPVSKKLPKSGEVVLVSLYSRFGLDEDESPEEEYMTSIGWVERGCWQYIGENYNVHTSYKRIEDARYIYYTIVTAWHPLPDSYQEKELIGENPDRIEKIRILDAYCNAKIGSCGDCPICNICDKYDGDFENISEDELSKYYQKIKESQKEERRNKRMIAKNNADWVSVKFRETTDEDGIDKEKFPFFLDCSMPADGDEILVTHKNGKVYKDTCFEDENGFFLDSGDDWLNDIRAWMPMPEGYKGE